MLVEGIHVYLMVVKVFKSPKKMKFYMLIGWSKYLFLLKNLYLESVVNRLMKVTSTVILILGCHLQESRKIAIVCRDISVSQYSETS